MKREPVCPVKRRGYFGIGVCLPKTEINVGTLWRSAYAFGAAFIFTIGRRYKRQRSDTAQSWRHLPLYHYEGPDDFLLAIPYDCVPVAIERMTGSRSLHNFCHPERAIYILGPEDGSVPNYILNHCKAIVEIPTSHCLNVAVAGSIVMYDRVRQT